MSHPPRRQLLDCRIGMKKSDSRTDEKSKLITNVSNVGGFLKVEETISGSLKNEALNFSVLTAQAGRCLPSGAMLGQNEELGQTGTTNKPLTPNMAR